MSPDPGDVPSEPQRKRFKWEPAALMVLVLGLGLWIAFGPASRPAFPLRPGALTQDVRIGTERGVLEAARESDGSDYTFRLFIREAPTPRTLPRAQAVELFGPHLIDELLSQRRNRLFRTFNITSWASLVWIAIGLLGQLAFSGRMVLQWIVSERKRQSVISESFWWFSLFGGVALFSYFIWRADPVGILGQASGIVIYARNIRLLRKSARRQARLDEPTLAEAESAGEPSEVLDVSDHAGRPAA